MEGEMRARAEIVFPNNIRDLRLRRHMTQAQVGRMMDPPIGESTVSKMESGERRLTNLQLANLASILRCHPEEIPVVTGRDSAEGVQRWQRAQQEVVGNSIASGAAAAGYVLAQLRKKHGRTMQQVADASGVPIEQLLPRVPRSLLKEGAKWGRLGALERYALQRSIRYAATPGEPVSLPICGRMKTDNTGAHRFSIDRDAAVDRMSLSDLLRPSESGFLIRNFSQRLGVLLRPGALAYVDPRVPAAMGDIVFLSRKDGTADAAVVIGDGIGPLMLKMYNPEEQVPISDPSIAAVLRVGMLVLP
jgi:transcriptional regulator with XRE-family HTH domain